MWGPHEGPGLSGNGSLGLGNSHEPISEGAGSRGRATVTRGLESPNGHREPRRAASAYEGGSGSVSAPLSPQRLYAQLELGKGIQHQTNQVNWASYDPRLHAIPGMPVDRISGPSGSQTVSAVASRRNSRSGPQRPINGVSENPSTIPAFVPFASNPFPSTLRPLDGEPASYISPSTLLSPSQEVASLPGPAVHDLAQSFGRMGVNPPGEGPENPAGQRKADVQDAGSSK